MPKRILYTLLFLAISLCIESGDMILQWLYSTRIYGLVYSGGEVVANGMFSNLIFLVLAVLCFCKSFRWMLRKKASFARPFLWATAFSLVIHCDDSRYAYTILPCISYKEIWSMMLIAFLALDVVKLIRTRLNGGETIDDKFEEHPSRGNLLHVDETNVEDLLGRKKEASVLASYILDNISATNTIGVAVTGEWGAGKTVFLNYLHEAFCSNGITPIIFDPWTDNSKDIQSDFFNLLSREMKKDNDFELTSAFDNYLVSLKITTASNWFSFILMTTKHFFAPKSISLSERRAHLQEAMRKMKKPIVVFIDDCDRLYSEPLKETFSLIRTTADLPNLVIVTAYDSVRVDKLLEEDGGKYFLKKMFNLTHSLPKLSEQVARDFLTENIIKIHKFPVVGISELMFNHIQVTRYLATLRDCKSYLNMVQEDFIPYKTIADSNAVLWGKWLLLELLKYTDRYTYQRMKETPLSLFEIKKEREIVDEAYVLKKNIELSDETASLVNAIMSDAIKTYIFDIRVPEMYPLYFSASQQSAFLTRKFFNEYIDTPLDDRISALADLQKRPYSNIKQLISEHIYTNINDCSALSLLIDMLEAYVENMQMRKLNDMTHSMAYLKYVKALDAHPYLGALADRIIDYELDVEVPDNIVHESASEYIETTSHSYAVLAVMADVMKNKDVEAYAGVDVFFIEKLRTVASEANVNYEDIGWICGNCVAPNLYDKFLKEFLDNHFLDLLPMTLTFNHSDDEPYVVARHDGLKALFDTYDNYKQFIARWQKEQRFDIDILKQHYELVFYTGILNEHNAMRFSQHLYPALKPYDKLTLYRAPFSSVRIKKAFWQNTSRIKQENDFYFAMDAN